MRHVGLQKEEKGETRQRGNKFWARSSPRRKKKDPTEVRNGKKGPRKCTMILLGQNLRQTLK